MLYLKDLTNDKKRKQYFQEYKKNFQLIHTDTFNDFRYYSVKFPDGSFLTALEYGDQAIITLTKKGRNYLPIASTQTEIVEHLKNIFN